MSITQPWLIAVQLQTERKNCPRVPGLPGSVQFGPSLVYGRVVVVVVVAVCGGTELSWEQPGRSECTEGNAPVQPFSME